MAEIQRMPEVLAGVEEAAIAAWTVEVGAEVEGGTVLAEVETEKALVDLVSEHAGTIGALLIGPGETVSVGTPIAVLLAPGESLDDAAGLLDAPVEEESQATAPEPGTAPPADGRGVSAAPAHKSEDPELLGAERHFSSPLARRVARLSNLDVRDIPGTGPSGRVTRRDVDRALAKTQVRPVVAQSAEHPGTETIEHTPLRRAIARRLTESKNEIPHFYLKADARVESLLDLRKQLNESAEVKISVNDLVVKAMARALARVPEANVTWSEEGMVKHSSSDIAVAVSTDGGLVAPVVRDISTRGIENLAVTIRDLAERARQGRLGQHEIEGGSFTVSNLGMFGISEFSAIINPPHSGILAVGAAQKHAVVEGDSLVAGMVMTVTLSADHRAVDGENAARLLGEFVKVIENPVQILM